MSLSSVICGVLNSHKRFFLPAVAPAALNVFWLAGLGIAYFSLSQQPQLQITVVAIFILVGGLAQALVQLPAVRKLGYVIVFNIKRMWPDIKDMIKLMVPGMFGLAVAQINYLVDLMLASFLQSGSVAALQFANRLILLPLGVLGTAVATATLPTLSETRVADGKKELADLSSYTLRLIFTLLIPMAVLTILLRFELIQLLFERGKFSATESTPMTAFALLFYALGLTAFGGVKGAVQTFYSMKDTKTPVKIAALAMSLNIVLNVLLMGPLKHGGLALASSISSTINLLLLLLLFKKYLPEFNFKTLTLSFIKILSASLLAGLLTKFLVLAPIRTYFANTELLHFKMIRFFVPAVIGLLAFIGLSYILKVEEVKEIFHLIRNRLKKNG